MAQTPEGRVKDLCKKWLKKHNIDYWMVIPSPYGASTGMADLCCILPNGKWLAIETKRPGAKSKVTANQQKFLDTITANSGYAYVVDSQEDLDEIEKRLVEDGVIVLN